MRHMFKVIGFCDVVDKAHGIGDIVYFDEKDQLTYDHVPSQEEIRDFAKERGYYPSGKRGASLDRCDVVYWVVEDL